MNHQEDKLITFKLFVFKNQKPTEIRKFSLKSTDLSFENMEENLLAIFPNLKETKHTLLWKDHEEDFITLSTAKEFSTFEGHVTKSEANETKLFINFEDELFAASQNFEQSRSGVNFSCNVCHKNLTLMCLDCTTSKNLPQERKILNIINKAPVQLNRANENCEVKIPTTSTGSDGNNPIQKSGFLAEPVFNPTPSSGPNTFPATPAVPYQFGAKSSEKTNVNFKF